MTTLKIKLLSATAVPPRRTYEADGGYDICADEEAVIPPGGRRKLKTGIAVAIPPGYVGLMLPRSGKSDSHGTDVLAPVIDSGYTGEVHALVINHGSEPLPVAVGDRVAQMVVVACLLLPVEVVDSLGDSPRGSRGFGSSGG